MAALVSNTAASSAAGAAAAAAAAAAAEAMFRSQQSGAAGGGGVGPPRGASPPTPPSSRSSAAVSSRLPLPGDEHQITILPEGASGSEPSPSPTASTTPTVPSTQQSMPTSNLIAGIDFKTELTTGTRSTLGHRLHRHCLQVLNSFVVHFLAVCLISSMMSSLAIPDIHFLLSQVIT